MKTKILISAMALTFGTAAMAADTGIATDNDANVQVETNLGDPNIDKQGPTGGPASAQPETELGSPEVQAQGPEGKPADPQVQFELGQDKTLPKDAEMSASADFSTLDKDGDGYIALDELDGDTRDNLAKADANADGRIDQSEFSAFETSMETGAEVETKSGNPSEDLTESGRAMDKMEKPDEQQ